MLYNKQFSIKAPKQIELSISDFKNGINTEIAENIMPYKFSTNSYNYNFENGALIEGLGFEDLKTLESPNDPTLEHLPILPLGKEIDSIWHFKHYDTYQNKRMDKLMLYTKDKLVYYATMFSPVPMFFLVPNINFTSRPTALNYKLNGKDYVILTSNTDHFVIWNGEDVPQVVTSAPELSSICVHQDKLFATIGGQRNIIRYSSNLDPTNWTTDLTNPNNPYFELNDARGGVNKVISFLGYVFAFRDFGITKIKAYENSSELNISHLFVSGNKIYKNTICICGDRVLMLTKDGIYEFDGISTKKVDLKIDKMFENIFNDQAVASYHEGKYYVACKLNYPDDNVIGCQAVSHSNDTLIELDVKSQNFHIIRGIDVVSMTSIQVDSMSKMAFCFNSVYGNKLGQLSKNGKFFNNSTVKHWYSPLSDLGYPATQKLVKEVSLLTKYDCNITIYTETQAVTYYVKGKTTNSKVRPNIKGELIGIKIESLVDKANISNAKIKLLLWQ